MNCKLILLARWMMFFNGFAFTYGVEQNVYMDDKSSHEVSLIDIGERKMYLECKGTGSPTVVFVSGRSDSSDIWQTLADTAKPGKSVFSAVAEFTHACTYDRPGTFAVVADNLEPSRSTLVPQPTTPKNGVADLHALLTAAKVPEPFVLVGHSYGGLIVRLYASTYPNEVVGLVLVDTLTEFLYDELNPQQQQLWLRVNSNYSPEVESYMIQEKTDLLQSFEQLHTAPPLRPMPVIVLTSDEPFNFKDLIAKGNIPSDTPLDFATVVFQAHLTAQKRLANLLHAKHISNTHAGHYVHTEQPQLVIDSIREIVDQVRANKR